MTLAQIKAAAMELEPSQRESLAQELLLSDTDEERERIDAVWLEEVRRRDAAYQRGEVTARPAEEVIHRLLNENRS